MSRYEERVAGLRRRLSSLGGLESTGGGREIPPEAYAAGKAALESLPDSIRGLSDDIDAYRGVNLQETADKILRGISVGPAAAASFEAIIFGKERPVYRVFENAFVRDLAPTQHDLPSAVKAQLDDPELPARLARVFQHVARVDLAALGSPHTGTAFMVGPDRLLTNRHVAKTFADGVGTEVRVSTALRPVVAFGHEKTREEAGGDPVEKTLRVVAVDWIHPWYDAALLRVEGGSLPGSGLLLDPRDPTEVANRPIAVVGFPAIRDSGDPYYNDLQRIIFRGVDGVKRFQPGLLNSLGDREFGPTWERAKRRVFRHDSSTLGGNSGSAVIDLSTGNVLALHFYGDPNDANLAVPASELARDPTVRRTLVSFSEALADGPLPDWVATWPGAAPPRAAASPAAAAVAGAPQTAAPVRASSTPLADRYGPFWFERLSDKALAAILAQPGLAEAATLELRSALGDDEAEERIAAARATGDVKPGGESTGGDALVYLHGILGSHLVDVDNGDRYWLDPLDVVFGKLHTHLALSKDGWTNTRGARLAPAGHLETFYGRATRRWRNSGLTVHPVAYDWRRPLPVLAQELDTILRARVEASGQRVVLVCHSMGGVVASVWAASTPDWNSLVKRAVFVGSPIRGSFAPMEILSGTYPFLRAMAGFAATSGMDDLRQMGATFPGLLGMLPDPKVFTAAGDEQDVAELFKVATWPAPATPRDEWLKQAEGLKETLRESPILAETTAIVADAWPTVAGWKRSATGKPVPSRAEPGDGTVPVRSAAPAEIKRGVYVATGKRHSDLMGHPDIIDAVAQVARGEEITALPTWKDRGGDFESLAPESLARTESAGREYEIVGRLVRERAKSGTLTPDDVRRLLDPEVEPHEHDDECHADHAAGAEESTEIPELSGVAWVSRFRGDATTGTLTQPFRGQVQRFITAIELAGGLVTIHATFRPPQRAYLMHYAWRIAAGEVDPTKVPPMPGLSIEWNHGNLGTSRAAAKAMVNAYGLAFKPALTSRHCEGRAVDMRVRWSGVLQVVDATGVAVEVNSAHGTDGNPTLHAVGRSYGVHKLVADPPHWSDDGR